MDEAKVVVPGIYAPRGHGERVLVTGASGFVGSHCCLQLLQAGYKVVGTVRDASNVAKTRWLRNLCSEAANNLELVTADLLSDDGWEAAVKGCEYVLHVASPFPAQEPEHEHELIKPALEGTRRVLEAVVAAGGVKRVVLTSSVVAVDSGLSDEERPKVADESLWSNVEKSEAYPKSKTLAETWAWDFVAGLPEDKKIELCAVNPAFIVGPPLSTNLGTSFVVTKRLMLGDMPGVPHLSFGIVDVRDVALVHILAMTAKLPPLEASSNRSPYAPKTVGHRFIAYSDCMWFKEIAETLASRYSEPYKVPTSQVPTAALQVVSLWDPQAKSILPQVGKEKLYSSEHTQKVLGMKFRDPKQSWLASAAGLIEFAELPDYTDWQMGSNCTSCKEEFTFMLRRHHCRKCSQSFCHFCCHDRVAVPERGFKSSVRVCKSCKSDKDKLQAEASVAKS